MIYLIEYDRRAGQLIAITPFEEERRLEAEDYRLELEIRLLESGVEREIVLLEAASEDDLRRTHRRYFEALRDLGTPMTREPR